MAAQARQQPQGNRQRQRILRIGVILGGKIIEERLIRERADVSIGQSAKNTFSIPVEGLPRNWPLFVVHNGQYYLQYSNEMDGRVSSGSGVHTLDALKGHTAQQRGDHWVMQLPDTARGKISLGEMTLLFQFVTEPPRQPRPHLPASVRGTLADRIEPQLAIILACSIVFHLSLVLWAYNYDSEGGMFQGRAQRVYKKEFERPVAVIEDPLQFQQPTEPTDEPTEQPKEDPNKGAEEPKQDKPAASRGDQGGNKKPDSGGGNSADPVEIQDEITRMVDGMFSDDVAGEGPLGDISRRRPGTDLGKQIEHVRDSDAKVGLGGGSGDRGPRAGRDATTGTGTGPQVDGPDGPSKTAPKTTEKVPQGRINVGGSSSLDDTSLTPDAVLSKIRSAYMNGLKRCHKDLLKKDPTAGGKVTLKFEVGESGRVTRAKVSGFDAGVSACIQSRVTAWRFGVPKDSDGDPTSATFQITLALQAE